jgi:hypothetical protein
MTPPLEDMRRLVAAGAAACGLPASAASVVGSGPEACVSFLDVVVAIEGGRWAVERALPGDGQQAAVGTFAAGERAEAAAAAVLDAVSRRVRRAVSAAG